MKQYMSEFIAQLSQLNKRCVDLVKQYQNETDSVIKKFETDIKKVCDANDDFISSKISKKREVFKKMQDNLKIMLSGQAFNSHLSVTNIDQYCNQIFNTYCNGIIDLNKITSSPIINQIVEIENSDYSRIIKSLEHSIHTNWEQYNSQSTALENDFRNDLPKHFESMISKYRDAESIKQNCVKKVEELKKATEQQLENLTKDFLTHFPPEKTQNLIESVQKRNNVLLDVIKENNTQTNSSVHIGYVDYPLRNLKLCEYAEIFIYNHYYFLISHTRDQNHATVLSFPYLQEMDDSFNISFDLNENNQNHIVSTVNSIGLRLMSLLPPGKVNFTFIDPITQGETFAMFTRLVDNDDKSNKIINGKIWTTTKDIEDKLKTLTEHIANVIQRYLQGKYSNINEYNVDAEQNAEPYHILLIRDFPASFNENALIYLEKIISTGAKCGVYTLILNNSDYRTNIEDKKLTVLVDNCINNTRKLTCNSSTGTFMGLNYDNKSFELKICSLPNKETIDALIPVLKSNIKNADHIVINFSKIHSQKKQWFSGNCLSELSIPIGIHGANQVQNLVLGSGENHHALIAGQIGSGKSSLLHTIIMSSLIKYPANQLQIFLVDFKRGVEFKVYANYMLENFRVIATESEREFGCSVLAHLDKEQAIRAEKFKRYNVDNLESYCEKSGEIIPRILLIVDEFHVLFSKDSNDNFGKDSATYLEQIIRQGRAFGIHVILASQTVSGISSISHGVWGQIGIRIALKCSKNDARFILGSDNDGIDLLSPDNPGQAIYNSDGGNVVANTLFRVAYIEQDEQEKYLTYISENAPTFDMPEPRIMLSNIEDNIHNPFQKYAQNKKVDFSLNQIIVGESLKVINNLKMVFKRTQNSNLLVVGNDETKARTLFTFAVLSLAIHCKTINKNHIPEKTPIYLFDFAPLEDDYEKDILLELANLLPHYVRYIPYDDSDMAIKEVYQDMIERENSSLNFHDSYMMVYGLQRARNFRSSDVYKQNATYDDFDEFGETPNKTIVAKPYEMFLNILQRGSLVGINSLIWQDNFKVFLNYYADMLDNFDMRIAFTMPDDDSIAFIETSDGSSISENGAIFNYRGNQKFRPYKKPDLTWLKNISDKLENNK